MSEITLCGYNVLKKLGEGSMSEVFEAVRVNSGQRVAIKVLRHYFKEKQNYIDRLSKEAEALAAISDDRIVKFFDTAKTDDGRLALVFELVEGKNLDEVIRESSESGSFKRRWPIIGASLISEVLLGLEEAHRQGIVHRDLKPENIMLTPLGRIKITDFGVARNLESQELTMSGIIVGSPAYMSPEQALGEAVDHRADLFSLGVLLYKVATGCFPHNGNSYQEMVSSCLLYTSDAADDSLR